MIRVMKYCVATKERGFLIKPERKWDGASAIKLRISGKSDSEYMKDPSRHSVNGWVCYLEGSAINCASKMMPVIALSVTEAELYAAVQCVQDMMFAWRVISSIGLEVELPMLLEVDNKGAVDLCHNWSIGGRTRHVEVKMYFIRELQEKGILKVKWRSGKDMTADIFTKNLNGPVFEAYAKDFVGDDQYMMKENENIKSEEEINRKGRSQSEIATLKLEYYKYWNKIVEA